MPVHKTHTAAKPQGLTWPAFKNKQNSQARDKPQCIHTKNMVTLGALFFLSGINVWIVSSKRKRNFPLSPHARLRRMGKKTLRCTLPLRLTQSIFLTIAILGIENQTYISFKIPIYESIFLENTHNHHKILIYKASEKGNSELWSNAENRRGRQHVES